jgi:hypothetical protein
VRRGEPLGPWFGTSGRGCRAREPVHRVGPRRLPEGSPRQVSGISLTAAGTSGSSEGCATRLRGDRRTPCAWSSDPLDAVSAARAAQSRRARGAPKGRDGAVEAIRALMVAKRSARSERTQTINQARALVLTGPDDLRTRFSQQARRIWSPGWWRGGRRVQQRGGAG